MNSVEFNELLELGLRRGLTADEARQLEAHWSEHPADRQVWMEEMALKTVLWELPDVPMASNFTSQVLRLTDQVIPPPDRPFLLSRWNWTGSFYGIRRAVLVLGAASVLWLCSLEYRHYSRATLARCVAVAFQEPGLPGPDILKDFEAINRLSQVPPVVDNELLVALQ
jgi:hypothetical protein